MMEQIICHNIECVTSKSCKVPTSIPSLILPAVLKSIENLVFDRFLELLRYWKQALGMVVMYQVWIWNINLCGTSLFIIIATYVLPIGWTIQWKGLSRLKRNPRTQWDHHLTTGAQVQMICIHIIYNNKLWHHHQTTSASLSLSRRLSKRQAVICQ
jgi:hypothetical protein